MNFWQQVRIPLLAFIFTTVVLVLVRVVLLTAFPIKQKDSTKLLELPLQTTAFLAEK